MVSFCETSGFFVLYAPFLFSVPASLTHAAFGGHFSVVPRFPSNIFNTSKTTNGWPRHLVGLFVDDDRPPPPRRRLVEEMCVCKFGLQELARIGALLFRGPFFVSGEARERGVRQ